MALLDSVLGGMGGMQSNPFEQYRAQQANPFTRQLPGMEYLSGLGQQSSGMGALGGMRGDTTMPDNVPTDFAGVPPGLPNLPENLQGFGYGQSAPQMNVNNTMRQALIRQLLQQVLPSMGAGGSMGNMGAMPKSPFPVITDYASPFGPRPYDSLAPGRATPSADGSRLSWGMPTMNRGF